MSYGSKYSTDDMEKKLPGHGQNSLTAKNVHNNTHVKRNTEKSTAKYQSITITPEKKLPPLPLEAVYTTPYSYDTNSETSTAINSPQSTPKRKPLSGSTTFSFASTIASSTQDLEVKQKKLSLVAEFTEAEKKRSKTFSFMNYKLDAKKDLEAYEIALNYRQLEYSQPAQSDDPPPKTLKQNMCSWFTKANLAYTIFFLISLITTVVCCICNIMIWKSQAYYKDHEGGVDWKARYRSGVVVYAVYLMYSKIYQLFVVSFSLKSKNNSQLALLFVYLFLFTIFDLFYALCMLKVRVSSMKLVIEEYAQNSVDILHDNGKHPAAEKQFNYSFQMPAKFCIVLIVLTCVFLVSQICMWIFYIAKDFSWKTFKKSGASISARRVIYNDQFFSAILVFIGGMVPMFFITAYIISLKNNPFFINGLVLTGLLPFFLVLNNYSFKRGNFSGLVGCMLYYCYLFLNLVQFLSMLQAKALEFGIFIQYFSALPIFLSFIAAFIGNCKKISECDLGVEITARNLNCIFLFTVNFVNIVLGIFEIVFFARYNYTHNSTIQYANNWMVCFLFGFCYCVLITVLCSYNSRHYINFLSLYLIWLFNCLVLSFQFSNILFAIEVQSELLIGQGLQLGVLFLISIFWCIITLCLIQIFRNNNIEKVGTYNIESYKASESNQMMDFKTKSKVVQCLEYLGASNIIFTYLICVFSIQYLRYSTPNYFVTKSQISLSIAVGVLMTLINIGHYVVINTLKYYIIGLTSYIVFSAVYVSFPLYCLIDIGKQYAAIENQLLFPETTNLKISMTLSVIMLLVIGFNVFLSGWIIKLQRSLTY